MVKYVLLNPESISDNEFSTQITDKSFGWGFGVYSEQ